MSVPPAPLALLFLLLHLAGVPATAATTVVASIAPLHSLAAAVMEGVSTPHLLLRGGQSPHTFSLRPSDARTLHGADVLFWIGPALELPLQRILPGLPNLTPVAMLDAPGLETLPARDLHATDPEPGDHAGRRDQAGLKSLPDPHVWLSPANAIAMADMMAQTLAAKDPGNAARYSQNAARLRERLHGLDRDLGRQLAGIEGSYVVFHDAYRYLEHRYGLHSAGTVTTHPERGPGAAHLRELQERLAGGDVRCLFSEPQFDPRLLQMLREGLDIRHAVLDPLGADIPPGADAYERMMRTIGDSLSGCMRGDKPR